MSKRTGTKRKAAEAAETKAKRARGETDLSDGLKWSQHGEVMKGVCPLMALTSPTLPGSEKVVGFDIDFTVIKTASGRKFAQGSSDWEWWDECVPQKLRDLNAQGYRVIFFTNQAGIEKLKAKPEDIMKKVEDMIAELAIPVLCFVCTGNNHYRKPSTAMWDFFVENANGGVKVDLSKCKYVGDAAGRAKDWAPGKPKDFSCSDRKFAANIGIGFATPEEFFLGEKPPPFEWGCPDPNQYLKNNKPPPGSKDFIAKTQELVMMVGCPASGKSTFRKRYFEPHGYTAINRDTLGTMDKCLKACKEALSKGKSVIVDNTNPREDARQPFTQLAKKQGIQCRCFVMNTPVELAKHMNYVRQNQTNGEVRRIPEVGYNVYKKGFSAPTKKEGFSDIVQIDFIPKFDSKSDETLFKQWTSVER
ncbi:bifunctional polynucleotide phosphatase/kinase-like [Saccostrea echinata]|uniref:bifunctional polynucleotide phosphatase/kinase-like n=1 Tax=Saccostrea echinata TaxID=191078 RepID=UPI002A8325D1|nr:bifunctional polynucleotide phosphatase/kinase-like [Saccostrea echinata]